MGWPVRVEESDRAAEITLCAISHTFVMFDWYLWEIFFHGRDIVHDVLDLLLNIGDFICQDLWFFLPLNICMIQFIEGQAENNRIK